MRQIQPKIVFSPEYDIHFMGLEKLHPFDTRKYSRAWWDAKATLGDYLEEHTITPTAPISVHDLLRVHTPEYLNELCSTHYIARAIEMPIIAPFPYGMVESHLLKPMQYATQGTLIATHSAMTNGIAVNLAGGYHHASSAKGEGFCLYADVAIAIEELHEKRMVSAQSQAVIIDLDAHQGNGNSRVYRGKDYTFLFDMYNASIYPHDTLAQERIDYGILLNSGCNSSTYLDLLYYKLPEALKRVKNPSVVFYIAGTDPYEHDMLGGLRLSELAILERDKFVIDTIVGMGIPLVVVLGGGYHKNSYKMISRMVIYLMEKWGKNAG
ncbi:MAG: histone deacetylase [Phototrophicales bacterium]|nr:histone deacetylase [Phototrophicales bacterium]